jgi:predicted dehydrogenase
VNLTLQRRDFLRAGAAAALASVVGGGRAALGEPPPGNKLRIACIGVGGRGAAHVAPALAENLAAICDVSQTALDACQRQIENIRRDRGLSGAPPRTFHDYRQLFDQLHRQIDAVVVATPDHHHAPAAMRAIKLGKHVYCEKPLTYCLDEARRLALAAREAKLATQLGIQGRAMESWRLMCEWLWAGAIGNVREAHAWTNRPGHWWPQGGTRPQGEDPVPEGLHWDEWLGPAPRRPYLGVHKQGPFQGRPVYHPMSWRGWWDFGCGALGDMGCHILSGLFTALKIEHAEAVELVKDSGDGNEEMFPNSTVIRWDIPARGEMPPCKIFWYDGQYRPPRELLGPAPSDEYLANGAVLIGEKGSLTDQPSIMPEQRMRDFKPPEPSIPRCKSDHFGEWVAACKGGSKATADFDHGGPLTEMVLLGNLAIRAGLGKKVVWDGPNLRSANLPELNRFITRQYRPGWEL